MTDLSSVQAVAENLYLSEATVDTPAMTASLAELKQVMLASSNGDAAVDQWLSQEHMAGGVLATAATMNKRGELAGTGNAFNIQDRATLINRYNAWAAQLVQRLQAVEAGRADAQSFLVRLAAFKADPIHNEP